MLKEKYLIVILFFTILLFFIPNVSNATELKVTRDMYSNNGSMKFNFKGLNLDITHEYEFGITKYTAEKVETWYIITEYTESTAVVDIKTTIKNLREVVDAVDTGYITIKDKTSDTVVLGPYSVDFKIPFLRLTNYTIIPNGKNLYKEDIQIAVRNASNSKPYYQYEKITDQAVINKYKEIKSKNGNFMEIENMLKITTPTSNWKEWGEWNGYGTAIIDSGHGYTEREVSVPGNGLYYMWIYISGINVKNVYGYILVDNLQPDIALENISLPKTETLELGKTLTLTPTFNPSNCTNKIVTWSSSDNTVATIDNAGKISPKKLGSTIITVISQDGNKQATCTVTVVEESQNTNNNENSSNTNTITTTNNENSNNTDKNRDNTMANKILPKTGVSLGLICTLLLVVSGSILVYIKYNKLKDVK